MAYIDNNFINSLLAQADIVDVISRRVSLKKAGKDYRGPCPFHQGKNNNLAVSAERQFYHCFKCGASGNLIKFLQTLDNLDFVDAVETLAEQLNMPVVYENKHSNKQTPDYSAYYQLMAKVSSFYENALKKNNPVINYLKGRGITGKTAKMFALGFAPNNSQLFDWLEPDKTLSKELVTIGLFIKKEGGEKYYPRFYDRLMFPIPNRKGEIVGFGGRILTDNKKTAKYLNSPETPIFHKNQTLYGFYQACKYTAKLDRFFVVEGYMDVVSLFEKGITNAVATLGTATSETHLKTLLNRVNQVVFCFDGDAAGKKAAWRALEITLPLMKPSFDVRFLFLPDEQDPDSFVQKFGKNAFLKQADTAPKLSRFLFSKLKAEVDFNSVEGKAYFQENAVKLIKTVTDDTYQQQLKIALAEILKLSTDTLEVFFGAQPKKIIPVLKQNYTNQPKNNMLERAIKLILFFPRVAEQIDLTPIKKITRTRVLVELINSAQLNPEITATELLEPFKNKAETFNPLKKLVDTDLVGCANEEGAIKEFADVLFKLASNFCKEHKTKLTDEKDKSEATSKIKKATNLDDLLPLLDKLSKL